MICIVMPSVFLLHWIVNSFLLFFVLERVIYARTTANPGGHGPKKEVISPEEGEAIPEALAIVSKYI